MALGEEELDRGTRRTVMLSRGNTSHPFVSLYDQPCSWCSERTFPDIYQDFPTMLSLEKISFNSSAASASATATITASASASASVPRF